MGSEMCIRDSYYNDYRAVVEVNELTNAINSLATFDNDVLIGQYNGHSYFYLNRNEDFSLHLNNIRNSPEKPYMVEFNTMEEWNWFKTQAVSVGIPNNQHYWIGLVRPHKYENDWGTDYDAGWEWYKSKVPLSGNGGGSSSSSPTLETTLLAGSSYTYTVLTPLLNPILRPVGCRTPCLSVVRIPLVQ